MYGVNFTPTASFPPPEKQMTEFIRVDGKVHLSNQSPEKLKPVVEKPVRGMDV